MNERGFSLIELAIALVIIGLFATAILKGQSMIDVARIDAAVQSAYDISTAVGEFKKKYKMLPGDMPNPPLSNIEASCSSGGNGDGRIDAIESACVTELLFKAGMIEVDDVSGVLPVVRSYYGPITVRSVNESQVVSLRGVNPFLPAVLHVVELENLSCDAALAIDRKLDNDSLASGRINGSSSTCTPGGADDPLPVLAFGF